MKPQYEKSIEFRLWVFVLMLIVALVVTLTSCSTSYEAKLCTPDPNYYKIVWCDEQFVYVEDPITLKVKKTRNVDKQAYFVGSYLIDMYGY
jgi:hypothetical protein